jgi:hypothetical protein
LADPVHRNLGTGSGISLRRPSSPVQLALLLRSKGPAAAVAGRPAWVSALVQTIFEQPDAASVRAQHHRVVTALEAESRPRPRTWTGRATTFWP